MPKVSWFGFLLVFVITVSLSCQESNSFDGLADLGQECTHRYLFLFVLLSVALERERGLCSPCVSIVVCIFTLVGLY